MHLDIINMDRSQTLKKNKEANIFKFIICGNNHRTRWNQKKNCQWKVVIGFSGITTGELPMFQWIVSNQSLHRRLYLNVVGQNRIQNKTKTNWQTKSNNILKWLYNMIKWESLSCESRLYKNKNKSCMPFTTKMEWEDHEEIIQVAKTHFKICCT